MKKPSKRLSPVIFTVIVLFSMQAHAQEYWHGSSQYGAVCAGWDNRAVNGGLSILKDGGTAADAAVAVIMCEMAGYDFSWFCSGAEVPFIYYDANKKEVKVLSGQGVAPLDPSAIDWYMANGIPKSGSKAMTLPVTFSLYFKALQLYGNKSFEDVAQPVLSLLDGGDESWYPALASTIRKLIATEQAANGSRVEKLQAARDRFYKGDIADVFDEWFVANSGFFRKADFEAYETPVEDAVSLEYRGYTVHKCGPWTQGPVLLQSLAILERYDINSMGHLSTDFIHHCTEAIKLAFADRDKYYGDPLFVNVPLTSLLSEEYTDLRYGLINPSQASNEVRPGDPFTMQALSDPDDMWLWDHGTTTCAVADQYGNLAAATPSGNGPYTYCDALGIHLATRLSSLNTQEGHPNCIEPGKRPRTTLTPTIVTKDGKPVLAISVAGSDMQDQTTLNLILDHVEFGFLPAEAVRKPRFQTDHLEDSFNPSPDRASRIKSLRSLEVNSSVPQEVISGLSQKSHNVSTKSGNISYPVMIYRDDNSGTMYAAGDPDAGRYAGALNEIPAVGVLKTAPGSKELPGLEIAFNHLDGEIALSINTNHPEILTVSIYELAGRLVSTGKHAVTAGKQTVRIQVGNNSVTTAAGCLAIRVSFANQKRTVLLPVVP
jgi:gamma-glutamyltranspeptidase/glutathione hydrolase